MSDSQPDAKARFAVLPPVPGGWTEQEHVVAGHRLTLARPIDADQLLDDPITLRENQLNGYTPYWCWLWPAAIEMASVVPRLPLSRSSTVLELGCGLGLVGIVGLLEGLSITLSDYREEAVRVARYNATRNGFPDTPARRIDWNQPTDDRFDTILACDVLYELSNHTPLLQFLSVSLADNGVCWIGDPGRQHAGRFVAAADERFAVELFNPQLQPIAAPTSSFFLVRLSCRNYPVS